jgi:hypothetical protein
MPTNTYLVTAKCTRCQHVYQVQKFNNTPVGSTTTPNAGMACPGCQRVGAPATVLSVARI